MDKIYESYKVSTLPKKEALKEARSPEGVMPTSAKAWKSDVTKFINSMKNAMPGLDFKIERIEWEQTKDRRSGKLITIAAFVIYVGIDASDKYVKPFESSLSFNKAYFSKVEDIYQTVINDYTQPKFNNTGSAIMTNLIGDNID